MTNGFKGLDLIDRMPEEPWKEGHHIVQEAVIKTTPKKKKCKKEKWLPEEDLKIVEKRREAKGKGKRERYTHLKAESQRIAKRDKKAFLSEQCKEIDENNRMGKTIEITSRKFEISREHFMQSYTHKEQNSMNLTEAEDIKKKWQEYKEELYPKKDLMTWITTMVWSLI